MVDEADNVLRLFGIGGTDDAYRFVERDVQGFGFVPQGFAVEQHLVAFEHPVAGNSDLAVDRHAPGFDPDVRLATGADSRAADEFVQTDGLFVRTFQDGAGFCKVGNFLVPIFTCHLIFEQMDEKHPDPGQDPHQITLHSWDKVASVYQDYFMDLDLYNDTYDAFCQAVHKPGARIFEIGCGPGNITRYVLAKRPDFDLEGIDAAPNMIALAQANVPAARFRVMDCRDMAQLNTLYDGILCGFCLPYLSPADARRLIRDCAALLPAGGIFYFSAIRGEESQSGYETGSTGDRMYVYYHSEASLNKVLQDNGFEVLHLLIKPFSKKDGMASEHLIFLTRKI